MKRGIVFLDRDGTIIEDTHYINDPQNVRLLPGAAGALRHLRSYSLEIVIVSNQSGVGRGLIQPEQLDKVTERFRELLQKENIQVSQIYYCLHAPEEKCNCRKPKTGMIPEDQKWDVAFMVGDALSDIEFGVNLKAKSFLVRTGKGLETEKNSQEQLKGLCVVVEDLEEAANKIVEIYGQFL